MIVIGITGSIGMGKTAVSNMMRDIGVPVHCADEAVHTLLGQNGDGVKQVAALFPDSYNADGNYIDRKILGSLVFQNPDRRKALENILHPLVRRAQKDFLEHQKQDSKDIAGLDIPLLFETGADERVDYTLCVTASEDVQRSRVLSREGMTNEKFEAIVKSQMPDAEKRDRADFIIHTDCTMDETGAAVSRAINKIKEKHGIKVK